ncbi:hypothetical protein [Lysobacter panacisoli]|uniref:Lipoprotein n=1 Tax=Lysobacter panacisoli TaxID=1255263 RepID=A0ABP9LMR3_9GAMM|nr:hypothetical protein [Lysobacter panacisoli]
MKSLTLIATSLFVFLLASCEPNWDEDPETLYDRREDALALKYAEEGLGGKHDFFSRMFLVQYHLARYLERSDKYHADRISAIYRGVDSLDRLPKEHPILGDMLWMAKYFDAAILLFVKKDRQAALKLLDSYCPMTDYEMKVRCHVKNYWHFESNARTGLDRNKQEAAFIADLTVGVAYQDYQMIGHSMELLAEYDIQHATERAMTYAAVRSADNDEVMRRFCAVPARYFKYRPETLGRTDYLAAYERADCKVYLSSDQAQAQ